MKKIIILITLLIISGCGNRQEDYYVCKFRSNAVESSVQVYFDKDNKITRVESNNLQVIDETKVKEIGADNLKEYLIKNAEVLEMDGVKVEAEFDDKLREFTLNIKIDVNKLDAGNLERFKIPESKKVNEFIKTYKDNGYSCNN